MTTLFEGCGLLATFVSTLLEGEVFFITAIVTSKLGTFSTTGALIAGFLVLMFKVGLSILSLRNMVRSYLQKVRS